MVKEQQKRNPEGILLENRLHKETSRKEEIHLETTLGNPKIIFFQTQNTAIKAVFFLCQKQALIYFKSVNLTCF
jgi:hypothetical protein